MVYLQGDVPMLKITDEFFIKDILIEGKKVEDGVIKSGKYTGNNHKLVLDGGNKLVEYNGFLFLVIKSRAEVNHDTHYTQIIKEPGIYKITKVLEYDPFLKIIREQQD